MNPFVPDTIVESDARGPSSTKELVGRSAELERLLASIAPIFSGRFAGLVYVDGEAGLGKSHLVDTARRRLEAQSTPFLWVEAPCDQTLQRSLNAFEVALEEYFEQSSTLPREENLAHFDGILARTAARVPPEDDPLRDEILGARSIFAALVGHRTRGSLYERLGPRDRFARTLAAIASWVRAESRVRPVILHLEDAHWADGDTLRAVQAIARLGTREEGAGLPIAIVCTARYTDDGGPFRIVLDEGVPVRTIGLCPLPAEGIVRIAESASGSAIPALLRAALVDGASGNAFFAEEIGASFRDAAVPPAETLALLPTDVDSLVAARLDRLPAQVKRTVLAAAVLGKTFEWRVLTAMVTGGPEVGGYVRVAMAEGILTARGAGRYGFRSGLLRDAAYKAQGRASVARLHLLAAEAIEATHQGDLERYRAALGRHYRRAGMPERARSYFLAAARDAVARYAHTEARRRYEGYLDLVGDPTPESAMARYELARDVFEPRGDFSRALDEHARVIEEAQSLGDASTEALGRIGLGRVAMTMRGTSDQA